MTNRRTTNYQRNETRPPHPDLGRSPIALDLPYPAAALWPNSRAHWSTKARATKHQRHAAHIIGRTAPPTARHQRHPRILAEFWCPGHRGPDPDNATAALKATLDGLTDAGLWEDDRELTILPPRIVTKTDWKAWRDRPGLRLWIGWPE